MIRSFLRGSALVFAVLQIASGQAVSVDRGVEIPKIWSAQTPLYVKGDLGVPRDRLDEFSRWLMEHAPNWTVVLLKNAAGEQFTDAAGQAYAGMDAVEHALGKTLPSATPFGELVHPQTGEKNGAFFILYLEERKLAYHALDAYDRRGLGEDRWEGNLDAPAIAAMRSGGRVLDAAKDTIVHIDRELSRRILQAQEQQAREVERVRRLNEETAAAISGARHRLADLKERSQMLGRDFGPGDLANPPIGQWSARLDAAERALGEGSGDSATLTGEVAGQIDAHLRALHEHEVAPRRLQELQERIDAARIHHFSAEGGEALLRAQEFLRSAQGEHSRAESQYAVAFASASQALLQAERADAATRAEVATLEDLEKRAEALGAAAAAETLRLARAQLESGKSSMVQLERAEVQLRQFTRDQRSKEVRRNFIRSLLIGGSSLAASAALILLLLAHRRSRAVRKLAADLYAKTQARFRDRVDGLFQLMDRTAKAVGSAETLQRSGWTGDTARLAGQTLADVDRLFILSSGIDRVLDQANRLIVPTRLGETLRNLLSRRNFREALELLESRPITFSPDDPIRPILHGGRPAPAEWQGLLGTRVEEPPFSLSFRELDQAFRERAERAIAALEVLERCWSQAREALEKLDASLTETEADERELFDASAHSPHLRIPAVFAELLPKARDVQEQAETLAATDPVAALAGAIAAGLRMAADAASCCAVAMQFHREILPAIASAREALEKLGRRVNWIGEALNDLSEQADQLAVRACSHGCAEETGQLSEKLRELADSAAEAVTLGERAAGEGVLAMNQARLRTERERQRLGQLLGLTPDRLLCESPDLDPSRMLDQAASFHAASLAEIDLGNVDAAAHALTACKQLCDDALALMDATNRAFAAAGPAVAALDREIERVAGQLPVVSSMVETLRREWAPSALFLRSADPMFPDENHSVEDCHVNADALLQRARTAVRQSESLHRAGKILQAEDQREASEQAVARAIEQIESVHGHARSIAAAVTANQAQLAALEAVFAQLEAASARPQSRKSTCHAFANAATSFQISRVATLGRGPTANPFEAASALAESAAQFEAIEAMIKNDARLYEEAARSLDAAEREIRVAGELARKSQSDGIPDSPEIIRGLQRLDELENQWRAAKAQLSVAHSDWDQLDRVADQITADAARLSGELRDELELAEQVMREIQAAAASVRSASSWLSSYGTSELHAARAGLASGDYRRAREAAAQARRIAENAIRAAEEEARRRRHAEERRREAARRSRSSSFSTSSGSRSSFSSGSSRSSFSSGSGSRRSSFSSGSGTRRSGW
jgi:hypothetical protein